MKEKILQVGFIWYVLAIIPGATFVWLLTDFTPVVTVTLQIILLVIQFFSLYVIIRYRNDL